MSPAEMAALHARVFTLPPPWSEDAFARSLAQPGVAALCLPSGFGLVRVIGDEAEILTLAVAPESRRQGHGRALLAAMEAHAGAAGASRIFLEVAAGNTAARALYEGAGYREVGLRRAYFTGSEGWRDDAVVMARNM